MCVESSRGSGGASSDRPHPPILSWHTATDRAPSCFALSDRGSRTPLKTETTFTFDLHPLYASILEDGSRIHKGDVLGLDVDLRRVLVAPVSGTLRMLVTGTGRDRRVRVFLTEQKAAAGATR